MALVRLSDVVIPAVYEDYTAVNSPEKTAFYESGVIERNALFDSLADGPSNITNMPFWNDLDSSVLPNLSTDNPADIAVPNKIGTGNMLARTAYLNQGYSSADLVKELAGENPMQRIKDRFGSYWQKQWQKRLIAAMQGVLAHNIATNAGDMVYVMPHVFDSTAFIKAAFTMGDAVGDMRVLAVHSGVAQQMSLNDEIQYLVEPSAGDVPVATYKGLRLVIDDGMPATATTVALGTIIFTSMIFGPAAFGYGVGNPLVPSEVFRAPDQGNGGGIETIWERRTWLLHPYGHSFTSASVAGQSPTNAELAAAANWSRVVPRKNVPIAFITSTLTEPT